MSFTVKWTSVALKIFRKLPKDKALRIWNKIESIKESPFRFLQHFEGTDSFKLRIGDYRALIDVDLKNKILKVRILDKRNRIYKQ